AKAAKTKAEQKKERGDLTDNDAKAAVLSAMLTPFHQGQVGSCFATAPCRKMREAKPLDFMKDLTTLVKEGKLTKDYTITTKEGNISTTSTKTITVPIITKTPANDNALLRGYEYSVAIMGARKTDSHEKDHLSQVLCGGYK